MRVAILSQDASLYSTRRLLEAGLERGHVVEVIDFLHCAVMLQANGLQSHDSQPNHAQSNIVQSNHAQSNIVQLWHKGQLCPLFDAVIPRIGPSKATYGAAVVRQLEMMGVPVLNSAGAISTARDKLHCYQRLAAQGLPIPTTGFTYSCRDIDPVLSGMRSEAVVIKLLKGSHGIGVVLAETLQSARALFEAFRGVEADVLVQECIDEARGVDLRCFVIGNQVAAAIQRKGPPGEFRANLHRGATAHPVVLTAAEERIAVAAARAIGLQVAGVDLLRSAQGPLIIEVNASPGLEGIEKATQLDLANRMIVFLEEWTSPYASLGKLDKKS
jgi:ribosomal protein S6--L-glutamate ligase